MSTGPTFLGGPLDGATLAGLTGRFAMLTVSNPSGGVECYDWVPARRRFEYQAEWSYPVGHANPLEAAVAVLLRAHWPAVLAAVRKRNRFTAEALANCDPYFQLQRGVVRVALTLREANPLFAERVAAQDAVIEAAITAVVGLPADVMAVWEG